MPLILDLLLVAAFLVTLLAGVRAGFFRELFALFGLVAAVFAGMRFTGPALDVLPGLLRHPTVAPLVVFSLIFLITHFTFSLIGGAIGVIWEGRRPGSLSRLLGLVVGGVRGVVLVLFLAGLLVYLSPPGVTRLGESRVLPYLSPGIVSGAELLPEPYRGRLLSRWGRLPFPRTEPGRSVGRDGYDRVAVEAQV